MGKKATFSQLSSLKKSGKLDELRSSGRWSQDKYDAAMNRLEGPNDDEPEAPAAPVTAADRVQAEQLQDPQVDAATLKSRASIAYDQSYASGELPWARKSGYLPGVGGIALQAGEDWDSVKDKVPGMLRDASLMPSRDAIWQEPKLEHARAEMSKASGVDPDGLDETHAAYKEFADKKWAEAYENARDHGKAIYRARDISDASPQYLKTLKKVSTWLEPLEVAGRSAANMMTGGLATELADSSASPNEVMHGSPETQQAAKRLLGVTTPVQSDAEQKDDSSRKADARTNIEQYETQAASHPAAELFGNVVGSAAPGAGAYASRAAESLLGSNAATGVIGSFAKNAGAGFIAGAPLDYSMLGTENDVREQAGMDPKYGDVSAEALKRGAVQGLFSGALGIPRSASNTLRSPLVNGARAADVKALEDAGGRTSIRSGIIPPPGYEAMADASPTGAEAGFRQQAADSIAGGLESRAGSSMGGARATADYIGNAAEDQLGQATGRIQNSAANAYEQGAGVSRSFDENVAALTEKVRGKLNDDIADMGERHQDLNEKMLTAEGAPQRTPPPGPLSLDDMRNQGETIPQDTGIDADDVPRVSSLPIIQKFNQVAARLAFADGASMPNTSAKRFKDAMDKMVHVRTVTEDELPLYDNIAIGSEPLAGDGEGLYRIAIPRKVNARELDDFVQSADEMAKMPVSTGPDAQRWAGIGGVAREMRKEAFPRLTAAKDFMHAERTSNEELLRSLGQKTGAKDVDGVDAVGGMHNAIKGFADGSDFKTPDSMPVPRKQFESWMAIEHPDMLDQYTALRKQASMRKDLASLGVKHDNSLPVQKESISSLVDALTGKTQKADAVMAVFGNMSPEMRASKAEYSRVKDVFDALGVKLGESVSVQQRASLRNKLMEVAINGPDSPQYKALESSLRPEQMGQLRSMHNATTQVDKLFSDAGLGKKRWQTPEAGAVAKDLFALLDKYKKFGASPEFSKAIDGISPEARQFLVKARGSSAFESLRNEVKNGASYGDVASGKRGLMRSLGEAMNYHLDALYQTSTKRSKAGKAFGQASGIAAPARAGVGLGARNENRDVDEMAGKMGQTVYTVGSKFKNMLVDAVEGIGKHYSGTSK